MEIFVAGASGVVGRRVVPLLTGAGHRVTAVARTPEQREVLQRAGADVVSVSLFEVDALRGAVAGHDAVINLATHMPASMLRTLLPGAWSENDRIRREGSKNLVSAAVTGGVRRFVQESFAPAYPDRAELWIGEGVSLEPARYNESIVDAEQSAAGFGGSGRSAVILRFSAFYGPDSRFLTDLARLLRHGFAPLPGSPHAFISSISHDDAAAAVIAALTLPGGTYNVTDDEPITHREYVDSLAATLGVRSPTLPPAWSNFLFGSAGRLLSRSLRISNRKLRQASAWKPRYATVKDGWRSLAATLRQIGPPHDAIQAGHH